MGSSSSEDILDLRLFSSTRNRGIFPIYLVQSPLLLPLPTPLNLTIKKTNSVNKWEWDSCDDEGDLVIAETETPSNNSNLNTISISRSDSYSSSNESSSTITINYKNSSKISGINGLNGERVSDGGRDSVGSSTSGSVNIKTMKPPRLPCFLCPQKSKNSRTLETHLIKSHRILTPQGHFFSCSFCTLLTASIPLLHSHFTSTHLNKNNTNAPSSTSDKTTINSSKNTTTSESYNNSSCSTSSSPPISTTSTLGDENDNNATSNTNSSTTTSNVTKTSSELVIRGVKGGGGSNINYFPCSHCSRIYKKQTLLDAHMRLVSQKDIWRRKNGEGVEEMGKKKRKGGRKRQKENNERMEQESLVK